VENCNQGPNQCRQHQTFSLHSETRQEEFSQPLNNPQEDRHQKKAKFHSLKDYNTKKKAITAERAAKNKTSQDEQTKKATTAERAAKNKTSQDEQT
jgi:hypothetical protein